MGIGRPPMIVSIALLVAGGAAHPGERRPDAQPAVDAGTDAGRDGGALDDCGTMLWTVTFDEESRQPVARSVGIGPDDEIVVGGYFSEAWGSVWGRWTRRYDAEGAERWVREEHEGWELEDLAVDASGNAFEAGTYNDEISPIPAWVTKRDASGDPVWTAELVPRIASHVAKYTFAIDVGPDGDPIVSGVDVRDAVGSDDVEGWLQKLDGTGGSPIWRTTVEGFAHGLVAARDGSAYAIFSYETSGIAQPNSIRRYDETGAETWTVAVEDFVTAVAEHPAGGVVVASHDSDLVVLRRFDADGREAWRAEHPPATVRALAVDADGRIAATGSVATGRDESDVWVASFDDAGALRWSCTYDVDSSEWGADVAFDSSGRFVAAGVVGRWVGAPDPSFSSSSWIRQWP